MIYVLSKDGRPLMPCSKPSRIRRWLKTGKAYIKKYVPFTVQLTYDVTLKKDENVILGIDPGRTNIGICVIRKNGEIVFSAECETRNKQIPKLMKKRVLHRKNSRYGERKARKRIAIRLDKNRKHLSIKKYLPHYEKPIICKVIKNTESRFANRLRHKGWLTPTARHLLQTHINLVKKIKKFLPIAEIVIENNKFNISKIENPNIHSGEYAKGPLFGFKNYKDAVKFKQHNKCLLCNNHIENYHHVKFKSKCGSDHIDNIVGLCRKCHEKLHHSKEMQSNLEEKIKGKLKKFGALSVINQIMDRLIEQLDTILPTYTTNGYETFSLRNQLHLTKTHNIDAWCIAAQRALDDFIIPTNNYKIYHIKQFRRHNRAIINCVYERSYYLGNKKVAKNRNKHYSQTEDSLREYREKFPHNVGKLKVKKSTRIYCNVKRNLPGLVFFYRGKRYVMGRQDRYHYGSVDGINANINKLKILKKNEGLVFI